MEFRRVELKDRENIERIRGEAGHFLLSHSFYTLFLWQDTMQLSLWLEDDFYVVRYAKKGPDSYFFPCGNIEKTERFLKENVRKDTFRLFYMRACDEKYLRESFGDSMVTAEARGSWEYIFSREEHMQLAGKKYGRIRSEENHLRTNHALQSVNLDGSSRQDAYKVLQIWEHMHRLYSNDGDDDYEVAVHAIEACAKGEMQGVLVYVDGEPQAIAIGCEITSDTYGIQVAKKAQDVRGLIFYVLHELFRKIPAQYEFINGDDDLDIPGLRIHKMKMQPCSLNEVWEGARK